MGTPVNKNRPVFLDLRRIRLPVTALVSIAHRVAGVLLFLCVIGLVYLLDLSLSNPLGFRRAAAVLDHTVVRLIAALAAWALAHHLFAGIRVLLVDAGIGVTRDRALASARVVTALGILVFVAAGWVLLS